MNMQTPQTAGVPKIAEKQEPTTKEEEYSKVNAPATHMAKGREKINQDILSEGDS